MELQPLYADLLPVPPEPEKAAMRTKLLAVLESEGEILPSANSPRGKLWHLVNSPDSSLEECAEVIQLDSALASRIFRVANSAAYASESNTILEAVQHLGMKFTREQVFNAGIFKQYSGWVLPAEWDNFWLRNILVARLCERLAGRYGATNGSEYLAGLIHDMGWLFLACHLPEEYGKLFTSGKSIAEAEVEVLPFGHAQIAAAMAARSKLPARAVDAIMYHHAPGQIHLGSKVVSDRSAYFLCLILNICDGLADNCGLDMFAPATRTIEEIQDSAELLWLKNFGLPPDLRAMTEEELTKSKEIFDIFFSNRTFK